MPDWVRVAAAAECPPGTLMGARAGSHFVVLANVEGDVYALEDRCSHENYPLADGELEGKRLTCMHHGATFDATTGRATGLPAIRPVRTFPVEVRGGDILVQVG